MSKRKIYHITPSKGSGWKVQAQGSERASRTTKTKEEAVRIGKGLAKSHALGQIIIHKEDGTIQTEHTYGKDPFPPKG